MSYSKKYTVTAHEMDYRYLLTPDGMLLYFQDTVACYLYEYHLASFDVDKLGLLWIVSYFDLHVIKGKRPYWFEETEIKVSLSEISPLRAFFDVEMYTPQGELYATGSSSWSLINSEKRCPAECQSVLEKAGMLNGAECTDEAKKVRHPRLHQLKSGELLWETVHKTGGRDFDQNMHVHNRVYTAAAFNCIPQEIYRTKQVKSINIKYERETFIGDEIICRTYEAQSPSAPAPVSEQAIPATTPSQAPQATSLEQAVPATTSTQASQATELEKASTATVAEQACYTNGNRSFVHILSNTAGEEVCRIETQWEPKLKQAMIEDHLRP